MPIVQTPDTCGGKPRIDGTRLTVEFIQEHLDRGVNDQWLLEQFPSLTQRGLDEVRDWLETHSSPPTINYRKKQKETVKNGIENALSLIKIHHLHDVLGFDAKHCENSLKEALESLDKL